MAVSPSSISEYTKKISARLGDGTSALIVCQFATIFVRFGSNLILTRIFAPEVYGVVAIVMSIYYILNMMSDLGLNTFITRHPTAEPSLIRTVWTARILRNLILATAMFVGAPVLVQLYNAPELTPAVRAVAVLFLLEAATSLSLVTAIREKRVIRLSVIEFFISLATVAFTIAAALYYRNFWAMIYAMYFGAGVRLLISYLCVPSISMKLDWHWPHFHDLWKYIRIIAPASIISIFLTQIDRFYIANFFTLDDLGKFMLAATIAQATLVISRQYVGQVFFPKFAEVFRASTEAAKTAYYDLRQRMVLGLSFLFGGVIGSAEFVVRLLFNDNYLGTEFYLSVLFILPFATLITLPAENAIVTMGHYRIALIGKIIRLAWVLIAGATAFYFLTPRSVIVVLAVTEAICIPYMYWLLHKHGLLQTRKEALAFVALFVGCAIGAIGNFGIEFMVAAGILPRF